jgi:hypothetical protein
VNFRFLEFNAMHYVAEFMERPLFEGTEPEQLYALLYREDAHRDWQRVGRFHARARLAVVDGEFEAVFAFAGDPPLRPVLLRP